MRAYIASKYISHKKINEEISCALRKNGMAMGNGTENCRKAAPYVTDTNEKDGVAKGILRFLSEVE